MGKDDPSVSQIILDELREHRRETSRWQDDFEKKMALEINSVRAEGLKANSRIDKYENRFWGLIIGSGAVGGGAGYTLDGLLKKLPWNIWS